MHRYPREPAVGRVGPPRAAAAGPARRDRTTCREYSGRGIPYYRLRAAAGYRAFSDRHAPRRHPQDYSRWRGLCPPPQACSHHENRFKTCATILHEASRSLPTPGGTCERGFRKSHRKCLRVKVPYNGKLNALANNWVCKRGFDKTSKRCLQVKIHKIGRLNYLGNDRTCEMGFFRVGGECVQLRLNDVRDIN